jgi:ketosteroid isomerase-like protein
MMEKDEIKRLIRAAYGARVRGDLEGTLAEFSDDAVFEMNARGLEAPGMGAPIEGKAAIRQAMGELIRNFKFSDWKEIALIVEGDKAALHWRANVTSTANGRSAVFDVMDLITFRDGKIADLRQNTDTAALRRLLA